MVAIQFDSGLDVSRVGDARQTFSVKPNGGHGPPYTVCALVGVLGVMCSGCPESRSSKEQPLSVFVAASLAGVTQDAGDTFSKATGTEVDISVAASGVLRRQIEAGAPCDVFISADALEVELLSDKNLTLSGSRTVLARNQLVIATKENADQWDLAEQLARGNARIAIGDPRYVPAGRYAKAVLQQWELWDTVEPRVVLADNVRVALQYVKSGQADYAIVYATDAHVSDCAVAFRFPLDTPEVAAYAVIGEKSPRIEGSKSFIEFLTDAERLPLWEAHGFLPPPSRPDDDS